MPEVIGGTEPLPRQRGTLPLAARASGHARKRLSVVRIGQELFLIQAADLRNVSFIIPTNHACRCVSVRAAELSPRRFPPPWSVEDIGAAFVVRDNKGQGLAYVYYEDEPGRRASAKLLTKDEALL